MVETKLKSAWYKRLSVRGLSIQQRLPLLICILLLSVIITFSLASYYSVKNAALEMGKNRLRSVTNQVSSMLNQSIQVSISSTRNAILKDTVKDYLQARNADLQEGVLSIMRKLKKDSTWTYIELLDAKGSPVLQTNIPTTKFDINAMGMLSRPAGSRDSTWLGKIIAVKDSMYYPYITRIRKGNQLIGYLVSWHVLFSSKKNIELFSQLMGPGVTLYIGNADGSFWTNMTKPVIHPAVDKQALRDFASYTDAQGTEVIGAMQFLPNTDWVVLIEVPQKIVLEAATRFRNWAILMGSFILAIGIFAAWLMSRNITRPLNKLTAATTAIASGDYSMTVEAGHHDELGKLARSFNTMAEEVKNAQQHLEKKVAERTAALETANKELEAFTYSVSHDLRAPLRGIIGFTSILEEEYSKRLDDEAIRLTSIIKSNTLKMGVLIDDLLTFSRLARQDIVRTNIDTGKLVKDVVNDLGSKNNLGIQWIIQDLPSVKGDVNALRQVWVNLISNAIKYSANKPQPTIEIGSFTEEAQTVFFVKDNGVGFDQQYAGKLFKVFQRLHNVQEFEGTGVGLAIVEKIISKHDGKVWVLAERDKGACFYFSLPATSNPDNRTL